MNSKMQRILPLFGLAVIALAAWWFLAGQGNGDAGVVTASGFIEAEQVVISPEIGGRVRQVNAVEGQEVKAGEVLVEIDTAALTAQRTQAAAALEAAQAGAEAAQASLDLLKSGPSKEQLAVAQAGLDQAQVAADAAQKAYDDLSEAARDTAVGKELKNKTDLALAALVTAQAQYDLTASGARKEQIKAAQAQADAAQAQVQAAQAALDLLDIQIAKLSLTAPLDGVVLERAVQPGEMAAPLASLLVIGRLDQLTVTVYVPEDRYGLIHLGDEVTIAIDSFPEKTFSGRVAHIADQAEFTPRNVQTSDSRKTTVFAIRISVDNPEKQLKPGMPADVTFNGVK